MLFRSTTTPRSTTKSPLVIPASLPTLQRPTFRDLALSTRLGRQVYALLAAFLVVATVGGALVFAAPMSSPTVSVSGLYTSGAYLCRTWRYDGYAWTHCTHYWHRSGSALVSDNPGYVPNTRSVVPSPYVPAWVWQGAQHALVASSSPSGALQPAERTASGTLCQWCFTGIAATPEPAHANVYPFGQCTDYAQMRSPRLTGLGNAWEWAGNARARGFPVGNAPTVGATVVFAPGVQGAGGLGHVAHVEAVYGGGWFLVSESNFYWNGGGFGRVDYRYAHTGAGVSFIDG